MATVRTCLRETTFVPAVGDFLRLIPRDYVFSTFLVPYAPLIGPGWIDKRPMARSDPGDRLAAGCRPASSRPPGAAPPPP